MAHISGDPTLKKNFEDDKDPYATVGQFIFHKDYWDCMEVFPDGTSNTAGKLLRKRAKNILLGTMYGMGANKMASTLGVSVDECKQILAEFAKMFPKIKEFTTYNEAFVKENGYVEDYLGRIRHLPDARKKEIEVRAKKSVVTDADVFFGIDNKKSILEVPDDELTAMWEKRYEDIMSRGRWNAKNEFKKAAKENGIDLIDNGAFISKTMTQCSNSRIQGSAASLTKKAMVAIDNDPIMQNCDFHIMVPVHDELLGECPIEYVGIVEKRLTKLMVDSALPECSVGMKCDAYVVKHWYEDEVFHYAYNTLCTAIKGGKSQEQTFDALCKEYPELKEETLRKMCDGTFDVLEEDI